MRAIRNGTRSGMSVAKIARRIASGSRPAGGAHAACAERGHVARNALPSIPPSPAFGTGVPTCAIFSDRAWPLRCTESPAMDLAYRVILEPEPDRSAYTVIVPAFPGAHTWGGTVDEALAHGREVIELEIEDRRERGEPFPPS